MDRRVSVTIHSTGFGGSVVTEDGKLLENIHEADVYLQAGEPTRVNLSFLVVPVNLKAVIAEATLSCILCGHSDTHDCSQDD